MCVGASGLLFALRGDWQSAVVFCTFGGVLATQELVARYAGAAQQAAKAADELAAKAEQLKALDNKVNQLNERMLRYETRAR